MDEGCGGVDKDDNFECIFAPLSSTCSIADTNSNNSVYYPRFPDFNRTDVGVPVRTPWAALMCVRTLRTSALS